MQQEQYGLELTKNSKVGWAFSLSRKESCIGRTEICTRLCYGNGIRYGSASQKAKRERNYRTAVLLLERGGSSLLAENLIALVDQARPRDYLAAKLLGVKTQLPWSLRLHDVGDFFDCRYIRAWRMTVENRPECSFWFYTRSFSDAEMLKELTGLASLPNCQGWLSADSENYLRAIEAYKSAPGVWKVALLQEHPKEMPQAVIYEITKNVPAGSVVNFPYHRAGWHVEPIDELYVCPQVTGIYPLQAGSDVLKPCQQCSFCLP